MYFLYNDYFGGLAFGGRNGFCPLIMKDWWNIEFWNDCICCGVSERPDGKAEAAAPVDAGCNKLPGGGPGGFPLWGGGYADMNAGMCAAVGWICGWLEWAAAATAAKFNVCNDVPADETIVDDSCDRL